MLLFCFSAKPSADAPNGSCTYLLDTGISEEHAARNTSQMLSIDMLIRTIVNRHLVVRFGFDYRLMWLLTP